MLLPAHMRLLASLNTEGASSLTLKCVFDLKLFLRIPNYLIPENSCTQFICRSDNLPTKHFVGQKQLIYNFVGQNYLSVTKFVGHKMLLAIVQTYTYILCFLMNKQYL